MDVSLRLVRGGVHHLLLDALNNAGVGYKGILKDTPHLALFKTGAGFSFEKVLADFVEADYDGYAREPLTFTSGTVGPTGREQSMAASVLFNPSGDTTPCVALGILLVSALTTGTLWGVGYFPAPIDLSTPAKELEMIVKVALPSDVPDWGVCVGTL